MVKKIEYETAFERERKEKQRQICLEYLDRADDILVEGYKPQRVFDYIARKYKMTTFGVKNLITRKGIYVNKNTPVVFPEWYHPTEQQEPVKVS